ncbi:MAG TPA: hypothetical protein VH682_07405 [Gemmataceae bacterium]
MAGKKKAKTEHVEEAQAKESVAVPPENEREKTACNPIPVNKDKFNDAAVIPYGCTIEHIHQAMNEFVAFLGFINTQLNSKGIQRLECMLMPANFSSMVGEFMISTIPKYCSTLAKNQYHNGHPDLLPKGMYPDDSLQHGTEGIEIKASRYSSGWQGHNAEECWLMVVVFEGNRPADKVKNVAPLPFRFKCIFLGRLTLADWSFSGRGKKSRRTITASVTKSGFEKMTKNWIYRDDD